MEHVHAIGRKNRGRFVSPHLRCVYCGKTTNNKPFIACSASNDPGGRLCFECKSDLDLDENFTCTELNKNKNNGCADCGKAADTTFNCAICYQEKCEECILEKSFEMFVNTGSTYLICSKCYPPEFAEKDDFEKIEWICDHPTRFCFICREREQVSQGQLLCGFNPSDEPNVYLDVIKYHEVKNNSLPTSISGVADVITQHATASDSNVPATARTLDPDSNSVTPDNVTETLDFSLPKTNFFQKDHKPSLAETKTPIAIHKSNKLFMEQEVKSRAQDSKIAALESELADLKLSFKLVKLNAREPPIRSDKYFISDASTNVKPNDIKKDYADLKKKRAMLDSIAKPEHSHGNVGGPANVDAGNGSQYEYTNNSNRARRRTNFNFSSRPNRRVNRTHSQFQNE